MSASRYFESNYKFFGHLIIDKEAVQDINDGKYKMYIQIFYLPEGYKLRIDFNEYTTDGPAFFFASGNQYIQILETGKGEAHYIYYTRDFYCIQIHDAEVSCDGFLFNNIYNMPMTKLPVPEAKAVSIVYAQLIDELTQKESSHEEMIRTYLKQLIIRATRLWKKQQLKNLQEEPDREVDFFRDFSKLVEIHYRSKHAVAEYADLMGLAPKTLSAKFSRLNLTPPNDIIKDRIVLEAKRLLCYTTQSVKEIAYQLGYDDPAYFNRMFTNKTGDSPAVFKKKYHQEEKVQF